MRSFEEPNRRPRKPTTPSVMAPSLSVNRSQRVLSIFVSVAMILFLLRLAQRGRPGATQLSLYEQVNLEKNASLRQSGAARGAPPERTASFLDTGRPATDSSPVATR